MGTTQSNDAEQSVASLVERSKALMQNAQDALAQLNVTMQAFSQLLPF